MPYKSLSKGTENDSLTLILKQFANIRILNHSQIDNSMVKIKVEDIALIKGILLIKFDVKIDTIIAKAVCTP